MPLTIGVIAAPILGGIIGSASSAGDRRRAADMAKEAAKQFDGILPPEVRALIVQQFQAQGTYTPEIEQAISLGESEVAQMKEDPILRGMQMEALQSMAQRGRTGLGPEDRAALNQVRAETQRDIEAKRQQILQNMQARGQGGSGTELAMQIAASQQGADLGSEQSDRLAATASQNALNALSQYGSMAGSVRGQDLGVEQARASAADEFNRFNVGNQQQVQSTNISNKNQAQQQNLSEKQRIAETNINRNREEELRMIAAKQQEYDNKMQKAQARANALAGLSGMYQKQGDATAAQWSGMGSAVGSGAGTIYGAKNSKDIASLNAQTAASNAQAAAIAAAQKPKV